MERRSVLSSRKDTPVNTRYTGTYEPEFGEGESLLGDVKWTNDADLTKTALALDVTCRYAFPLTFLFFNIIYWFHYLYH